MNKNIGLPRTAVLPSGGMLQYILYIKRERSENFVLVARMKSVKILENKRENEIKCGKLKKN